MRKIVYILLCSLLLSGCGQKASENTSEAETTAAAAPEAETVREPELTYADVTAKAEEIGTAIAGEQWDTVASLFAAGTGDAMDAAQLQEAWQAVGEGPFTLVEADPVYRNEYIGGVAVLQGNNGLQEAVFRMNEALELEMIRFAVRPAGSEPGESDTWTETRIYAGNAPKIEGILTLPVIQETEEDTETAAEDDEAEEELPPVAVLMGEEMDDPMNESGSNAELRSDLAHALAENGVASVRFDSRCYADPVLCEVFGYDLNLMLSEDVASIFHTMENYPVNARKIVYVGHGAAGTMGYSHVYHHFEVTGGLVLINAPYTEDGEHLFQRAYWLPEEEADLASEAAESDGELPEMIGNYPYSFWQDWHDMGALLYTRFVAIPILIQQGRTDGIVSATEDYENWKSQKGSNVTMKLYTGVGHDLRKADGTFETLIAEDIADWLNGDDINSKKTEDDTKKETSTSTSGTRSKS